MCNIEEFRSGHAWELLLSTEGDSNSKPTPSGLFTTLQTFIHLTIEMLSVGTQKAVGKNERLRWCLKFMKIVTHQEIDLFIQLLAEPYKLLNWREGQFLSKLSWLNFEQSN